MKSYLVATLVALAAHVALEVLWSPYLNLLADFGARISHGNDVADIPKQLLLGNLVVGALVIAVVNGTVVLVNKAG